MGFKKDFMWGVATASYQIEGAAYEDGKGLSIWDVYCEEEGNIFDHHTGEIACDHYHRFREDVQIMKELGVKAYRFSISWPRVIPEGIGGVNEKGIAFYDELVNELISAGITPYVTLYHWDLPYALHKRGGWLNPESPRWFKAYATLIADRLGDRVKHFVTFNEPQCFIGLGNLQGVHAPGLKTTTRDALQMAHNVLLAHGLGVRAIREHAKGEVKVGWAPTGGMNYPLTNSTEDIEATRKSIFEIPKDFKKSWNWNVSWWNDPIFLGKYPEEGVRLLGNLMPEVKPGDLEIISEQIDFLGYNIYNGGCIRADKSGRPKYVKRKDGYSRTAIDWPITPEVLYWGPKFLYEHYGKPIHITENGLSCHDVISLDGKVHDPNRIDFLNRYLIELREAVNDGVRIDAYFQWSLMDNFEWGEGYDDRFGIVYVDYETQQRIIKDSGYWYKNIVESNGENL